MSIIDPGELLGEREGQVNAEIFFVEIGKIVNKGKRTPGVNKSDVWRIAHAMDR